LKKNQRVQKWYDILNHHPKFGANPPLHGGVSKKSLELLFLLVCLYVTLSIF